MKADRRLYKSSPLEKAPAPSVIVIGKSATCVVSCGLCYLGRGPSLLFGKAPSWINLPSGVIRNMT